MTPRSASDALDELAVQHAVLREMMERCEALADEVDVGMTGAAILVQAVARLRIAFDEHSRFEEALLHPLLAARTESTSAGTPGLPREVRIARIVDDHMSQHRAMRDGLDAGPTAALRGVLGSLREHLAGEERTLLAQVPRGNADDA
jgi:hemerythrin HHE cation binding domain-containing protein